MSISKQYIAGFIDGEGYLGILKLANKAVKLGYIYSPCVKIAQRTKDALPLQEIQKLYGGFIEDRKITNLKWQPSVLLSIKGIANVAKILNDIDEYLIIKKPQAKLIKEFISLGCARGGKDCPDNTDLYLQRDELYTQLRKLNYKGVQRLSDSTR